MQSVAVSNLGNAILIFVDQEAKYNVVSCFYHNSLLPGTRQVSGEIMFQQDNSPTPAHRTR